MLASISWLDSSAFCNHCIGIDKYSICPTLTKSIIQF